MGDRIGLGAAPVVFAPLQAQTLPGKRAKGPNPDYSPCNAAAYKPSSLYQRKEKILHFPTFPSPSPLG